MPRHYRSDRDCFVAVLLAMTILCCHCERSEAISRSRSDDTLFMKRGDRRGIVAEFAQHFLGVFALVRGRAQLVRLRVAAHMDRLADDVEGAELRMIDRAADAEMLHLRIGKDLVDRVDRSARYAGLVE